MEEKEMNLPKVDLIFLFRVWLRYARRFWALALAAMLLCSLLLGVSGYRAYTPTYEARMSFTVRVANPLYAEVNAYNNAAARQLHATFPYILRSAILQQRVREHLGVGWVPNVNTTVLDNSNIFTISVRHADPEWAYQVLQAVVACYPQVAEYVVGSTSMIILDDSGVPDRPLYELELKDSLILGALAGLLLWGIGVLLMALSRRTIHNEDELKRTVHYECLGIVPATKVVSRRKSCPLIHKDNGKFGFSESMRLLQMHVQKEMRQQEHKILMVSGATPGEGKTTIAVNLAIAFARKGNRVLLVDCDMYNPSVMKVLGIQNPITVRKALQDGAGSLDVIRKSEIPHLYLMSADVDIKDTRNKQLIQGILAEARADFDYVIVDTPPCSLLVDAAELSDLADCALMVIRQDYATRSQILEGVKLLTDNGMPVLGCAINGVSGNLASRGYRYGNGYGYGHGYGYHYGYGYGSKKSDSD